MLNGELTKEELEALDSVQFNFVNTTNSPINPDLFNTDVLANTPTEPQYIVPPFGLSNTYATGTPVDTAINPLNGDTFTADNGGSVEVYDVTGNFITSIVVAPASSLQQIEYCSVNNTVYVGGSTTNRVYVIDCATYTQVASITGWTGDPQFLAYSPANNFMYASEDNWVRVVDCSTNTIIASIDFSVPKALWMTYVPYNNSIYVSTQASGTIERIDCDSNTIVASIFIDEVPDGTCFAPTNNYLYVTSNTANVIMTIDVTTDTEVVDIAIPDTTYFPVDCVYDPNLDCIYTVGIGSADILKIDVQTNILSTLLTAPAQSGNINYDTFAERIVNSSIFGGSVYIYTTKGISANPLYVTGSSDYNCFVRNLETEPIILLGMWVISENQIQLSNPLDIKKRSADGTSSVMPDFPLLQVSTYQEQGNRAFIRFGDKTVFDGRTFFSDYKIDANQQVTFILLFDQFNRGNFSLKDGWLKKPLLYGITGDREYVDMTHNDVRHKYDENYEG